jgi:phage replication-related protein YjqB (UPF0714/DUF867 family)
MKDKYLNFKELQSSEKENVDYRIIVRQAASEWSIIAPHGGGIEPGTSELAEAIAKFDFLLYRFDGIKSGGNKNLHITSTHFDEPRIFEILNMSKRTIAIHGCNDNAKIIYIGGLDQELKNVITSQLLKTGFKTIESPDMNLQGKSIDNICNKNSVGRGVQLELSEGIRKSMFESLTRPGRINKTVVFHQFVESIRNAISFLNNKDTRFS